MGIESVKLKEDCFEMLDTGENKGVKEEGTVKEKLQRKRNRRR